MQKIILWFKMRTKKQLWAAGVGVAALILICIIIAIVRINSAQYFYIDWNNQKGVAKKCYEGESGLYCDREYGGKIAVKQYWRGE